MARQVHSWKLMLFSAGAFWLAAVMHLWRLFEGSRSTSTVMGSFLFPAAGALATLAAWAIRNEARREGGTGDARLSNAGGHEAPAAGFSNVYEDEARAAAYDTLEFPGTYHLAYRDLPGILAEHAGGKRALDFGCGTGRSTRFLKSLGYRTTGVDVSAQMVARARQRDPDGDYLIVPDGKLIAYPESSFDLVLSAFTFDNIATEAKKLELLNQLRGLVSEGGCIVNLVSSPDIYVNEWASFSTKDFPENRTARTGDTVRIVMLDVPDRRPVEDVVWEHEDYLRLYEDAGLEVIATHRPLATGDESIEWVSETETAPWVIYVLARKD